LKIFSIKILKTYSQEFIDYFFEQASHIGYFTKEIAVQTLCDYLYQAETKIADLIRLASRFSDKRLEESCKRVVFYGADSIEMVKTVLLQKLDSLPLTHNTDIYGQLELFY
jgi:hypothetical protein